MRVRVVAGVSPAGSAAARRQNEVACNQSPIADVTRVNMQIIASPLMKQTIVIIALLSSLQLATAQERLSREEALKYATAVSANAKQFKGTPIVTDVDTQKPVALRED